MSNIQKQHKISPAIAWLTIQKFIIFYCPLDGEYTKLYKREKGGVFLSDLCYQKDYKGDTSDARYNNDEFIQYTSKCFWYSIQFEDSHMEWRIDCHIL